MLHQTRRRRRRRRGRQVTLHRSSSVPALRPRFGLAAACTAAAALATRATADSVSAEAGEISAAPAGGDGDGVALGQGLISPTPTRNACNATARAPTQPRASTRPGRIDKQIQPRPAVACRDLP